MAGWDFPSLLKPHHSMLAWSSWRTRPLYSWHSGLTVTNRHFLYRTESSISPVYLLNHLSSSCCPVSASTHPLTCHYWLWTVSADSRSLPGSHRPSLIPRGLSCCDYCGFSFLCPLAKSLNNPFLEMKKKYHNLALKQHILLSWGTGGIKGMRF